MIVDRKESDRSLATPIPYQREELNVSFVSSIKSSKAVSSERQEVHHSSSRRPSQNSLNGDEIFICILYIQIVTELKRKKTIIKVKSASRASIQLKRVDRSPNARTFSFKQIFLKLFSKKVFFHSGCLAHGYRDESAPKPRVKSHIISVRYPVKSFSICSAFDVESNDYYFAGG